MGYKPFSTLWNGNPVTELVSIPAVLHFLIRKTQLLLLFTLYSHLEQFSFSRDVNGFYLIFTCSFITNFMLILQPFYFINSITKNPS